MNSDDITLIDSGSVDDLQRILEEFNAKHTHTFSFSGFDAVAKKRLGEILARKLADLDFVEAHKSSLEFLRLVARDKTNLENLINDDLLHILAIRARLTKELQGTLPADHEIGGIELSLPFCIKGTGMTTEAQKVLCNLVFHSASGQRFFSREEIVDVLMSRISSNKEAARWPLENQLLDMKLLFIITILCADTRAHLRNDLRAVQDLCVTATLLATAAVDTANTANSVLCEILKVLFNLVCNMSPTNLTLGEELDFVTLGNTCRELLISATSPDVKKHVINLLTVVKKFGYNQLLIPVADASEAVVPYGNCDLQVVRVILRYLDEKLSNLPTSNGNSSGVNKSVDDTLAPVLCALTEAAKTVPVIRKYLKAQVLPPLKEVHSRPEVGSSLRNKVCRLLTVPLASVRDNAGDFLYILCKNNVQRMIKYTGYGNAAGWLADRGMMGLPRSHDDVMEESEDSETEEYESHKHNIDPITGAVRVEVPNPMEGMSDEQKEYYANELAVALDKLLKKGDIMPAAVGPSGRPEVIDDILKYRETVLKHQNTKVDDLDKPDSDED